MAAGRHLRIDMSDRRRVLAASDPHGEFEKLQRALDAIGFDGSVDALILIGDLVDRGPDSLAFEEWISRDGMYRTLGNHDVLPSMYLDDRIDHGMLADFGGDWFLDLDRDERRRIARLLEDAPIAMTCRTPGGHDMGFIHADCTRDWQDTLDLLDHEMPSKAQWAFFFTLESRETIRDVLRLATDAGGRPTPTTRADVTGIDHVFHGHTPVLRPFSHGNRTWIDTDACRGGAMTVIDVDRWFDDLGRNSPYA
jgi:serine/threonine protein phosphatase 1